MNTFGQSVPVRDDETGEITGNRPSIVSRVTRESLDGSFGADRGRALIVSLMDGDIIALRPQGRTAKNAVKLSAMDVYRFAVRCAANRLERRAREIKKANGGKMASALKQARKEI